MQSLANFLIFLGAGEETASLGARGIFILAVAALAGLTIEALLLRRNECENSTQKSIKLASGYLWRLAILPWVFIGLSAFLKTSIHRLPFADAIQHHYHQTFIENQLSWQAGAAKIVFGFWELWELGLLPLAALVFIMAKALSKKHRLMLLGIMLAASAIRLFASPQTLMGMSNYVREPNIIHALELTNIGFHALMPNGLDRFESILLLNQWTSILLVLVFYCHAAGALRTQSQALFATLVFALAPIPIFFGGSDAQFITSMLFTCGTLALLHAALITRRWYAEVFFGVGALNLFTLSLSARQVNMVFAGIALLAAMNSLARYKDIARARLIWVGTLVFAGLVYVGKHVTAAAGQASESVPFGQRVLDVLERVGNPQDHIWDIIYANFYLGYNYFPLPISLLAVVGIIHAYRKERFLFLYLALWFVGFYLVHCLAWSSNIIAASRYGFHTITPVFFAAALGFSQVPALLRGLDRLLPRFRKTTRGVLLSLTLGTYILGLGLFRLPATDLQEEYGFLRNLAQEGLPPSGALLLEPEVDDMQILVDEGDQNLSKMRRAKRFDYFGNIVRGDELVGEVILQETVSPGGEEHYLYLGLPCYWLREEKQEINPACAKALAEHPWVPVRTYTIQGWQHDITNGRAALGKEIGLYRLSKSQDR